MSIYQKASLVQIPSGYKASTDKLYSVVPANGDGDFTVDVDADATRVNADGLIESVVADQARLNYDFDNPQDPHLLLEPTRTNYATNSNDASQWTNVGGSQSITKTQNYSTAPDGTQTATRLQATATGSNYSLIQISTTSFTGDYAGSVYLKSNTGDTENVIVYGRNTSVTSYAIGNEWQRIEIQGSGTSGQNLYLFLGSFPNNGSDESVDILVWGGQIEAGTYASSLIPTTTAAVTRTVDTCKLENFANIPTDYPFTAFVNMDVISNETGYGFSIIDISTPNIYFSVGYSEGGDTNKFRFTNRSQGTGYSFNTTSTYGTGRYKIAVKFISSTNFKAFIDGVEVADYTHTSSAFNSNINDVLLGQLRVSGDTGTRNPIHQFMVFNEALSDAELQTLTS